MGKGVGVLFCATLIQVPPPKMRWYGNRGPDSYDPVCASLIDLFYYLPWLIWFAALLFFFALIL